MLVDVTTLLEAADRLYGLRLPEFTPARDALARELRASDRALADQVKGLRKPSTAAWVVNLLVRCDPDQADQVVSIGAALREAQESLDGDELRALTRQRRQLTAAVTRQARGLSLEHGQKVTSAVADQVEATLTSAMVDQAAGAVVRTGLLLAPLALTGVEDVDLAAYVAVPDAAGFVPTPLAEPEPGPPDLHVVPDPDADEKRLAAARERLSEAEEAADAANEVLETANADVAELEARSLQVQAEIDELRRQLQEHEDEQDEIDESLAEAQAHVEVARDEVSVADAARAKAAAEVQSLA